MCNNAYHFRFIKECGSELLTLRLACCKYIGEKTLRTIGKVCNKLQGYLCVSSFVCACICSHSIIVLVYSISRDDTHIQ